MDKVYENKNVNSNSDSAPTLDVSNSNSGSILTNSNLMSKPSFTQISEDEQKKEIQLNYLPDLSNYQEISFRVKKGKNEEKEFKLLPDVNFEENKKGYYIFYNNNLEHLKELFKAELERLRYNNPVVLYHIKDFLGKLDPIYEKINIMSRED